MGAVVDRSWQVQNRLVAILLPFPLFLVACQPATLFQRPKSILEARNESSVGPSSPFSVDIPGPGGGPGGALPSPVFLSTNPSSPNNSIYPKVIGLASADTSSLNLYSENLCSTMIGAGTKSVFESTGITANVSPRSTVDVYAIAIDAIGNTSPCTLMGSYTNNMPPPQIQPPFVTMNAAPIQSFTFSMIGGAAPYNYSVFSGNGTIEGSTGVYNPPTTRGTSQIRASDSLGSSSTATVTHVPIRTNGLIKAAVTDGISWYLGGNFTAMNPIYTPYLAALDPTSGNIASSGCHFLGGFNGPIWAMVVSGNSAYLGGSFTTYYGNPAGSLAKIDLSTCALGDTLRRTDNIFELNWELNRALQRKYCSFPFHSLQIG